ncbi:MAG: glucosamine-6-phosphate deaminase [Peptoniphilaceae bacterium]|nr:glucosamine-6-phosphate deaminase [Peptoniphilaceae bacterium]MDY5841950.1 glucosamine-6-phosphate deaminase [Peptoniphilaceae bacterium]
MKVIVVKNYEEMSRCAADLFTERMSQKKNLILGLATGSTAEGLYAELVQRNQEGRIDFAGVQTFNLDEYEGISAENEQSYRYFMNHHLFSKVNINPENTHFPSLDPDGSGKAYDDAIEQAGGIDIQLLGLGRNGHIAFNEPDETLNNYTSRITLTQSTIDANSRFFDSSDEVPRTAISMGVGSIMRARELVILASGADKAEAVSWLLKGTGITTQVPATLTLVHPHVTLIIDEKAAGK